ncbi:hypothetical protein J2Q11_13790 [Tenacibaculum finnmarkense genomovar finnmarkense]|uniref:Uncharacterized protein n=1 Tax=Tenacibaculum finnmarkense genomovar finnmarkense TaxID=1458503 RepID=A0AAP1WHC4_9FLAO|nr:hypothetical protein [Tenacibaculum finnmarkense]MBE7653967.1 hypothetical protein [Tenacibaculum finnmarkense genomovar finnmarkense]MBE7661517.1 hypothetical protein [Tenacibaculum finnmarkense genomovar finnmarkense]MBE7696263.1 hypothetical protein [Tenacibaculum finnmarkense genomovar finnmarkense]MCD8418797.1 hypothetical protein [Tenacibaculum finnmarkense genomovar finnmarkense]MCD8428552.1 hypothetical protein [Tenacibaculum finnmarkense genomovar finnmarkense]
MKYKIILLLLITCLTSCNKSPIKSDVKIKNIKVYYIPFLITSHGSSTATDMRALDGFYIDKKNKLKSIKKELLKLTPIKDDFSETDVQLVCDFYNKEGKKEFTLLCDRFNIKINDKIYKNDKLIDLLISN